MDLGLPTPSYLSHSSGNGGYFIAYEIEGYFLTKKSNKYLNDIIARFLVSFKNYSPERCGWLPDLNNSNAHIYPKIYNLSDLQALESIPTRQYTPNRADNFEDYIFWSIKLHCEDLINLQGIVTQEQLEDFAYFNFPKKEKSTLRAKSKSIFAWYSERDFKTGVSKKRKTETDSDLKAIKIETCRKNNEKKKNKTREKIKKFLNSKEAQKDKYKKSNGKWNISAISQKMKMKRDTISKHLKEILDTPIEKVVTEEKEIQTVPVTPIETKENEFSQEIWSFLSSLEDEKEDYRIGDDFFQEIYDTS